MGASTENAPTTTMRPAFARHLEGLFHRLVLRAAHDFENGVRPVAAGQVLDSGYRIVRAHVYRFIRAHLPRHFQPVRHRVDGDDAGACVFRGGERAQAHRPHADDGYRSRPPRAARGSSRRDSPCPASA